MSEFGPRYVGAVLRTPEEFRAFLARRPCPSWGRKLSIHHTWAPDQHQWRGLSSLAGCFRYYRDVRGWPLGLGPHLWGGPDWPRPQWALFVGTDLIYQGVGVAGRNADTWHLEHAWNGDKAPFSEEVLELSRWVVLELSRWAGFPVEWCDAHQASTRGTFLHRDRRDAGKSCPGTRVTHAALMSVYRREDDDMTEEDRELLREIRDELRELGTFARRGYLSDVARSHDVEILKAIGRGEAPELTAEREAAKQAGISSLRTQLGL